MDIDYLYSVLNLYLKNEKANYKTSLSIEKKDEIFEFNFNMGLPSQDKTTCKLTIDDFNIEIYNILNIYKKDTMVIDEKNSNKNNYEFIFQNGRKLSFLGFTILEINRMRNIIYNITINSDEIHLVEVEEENKMVYKPSLLLQQAGFIANSNVFLIVLYLVDIFVIALWIFKEVTK